LDARIKRGASKKHRPKFRPNGSPKAFVGNAPSTLRLSPGKHSPRVSLSGYKKSRQALSQARAACALTPAAAPFAQKSLSINLDTHVREEQDDLEVSLFEARLPLRSPRAVSLTAKLRIERQEGSTSSARISPLTRGLTFCPTHRTARQGPQRFQAATLEPDSL